LAHDVSVDPIDNGVSVRALDQVVVLVGRSEKDTGVGEVLFVGVGAVIVRDNGADEAESALVANTAALVLADVAGDGAVMNEHGAGGHKQGTAARHTICPRISGTLPHGPTEPAEISRVRGKGAIGDRHVATRDVDAATLDVAGVAAIAIEA